MLKAIKAKLDSIERNETWELVSPPKKHKAIELGVKWVYQTKYKLDSSLDKHKGVGCPNVLGHYLAGHPFSLFPHFRGHEQVSHLCTKPINRLPPASFHLLNCCPLLVPGVQSILATHCSVLFFDS